MKTLTRLAVERPKAVIATWLLLLALSVPFALQLNGALKAGGFSDPRGESVEAQHSLEQAFEEAPNSLLIVLHGPDQTATEAVPAARAAADGPGVASISDVTDQPGWVSEDGRTTFLHVGYHTDNTTVQNLVPTLSDEVASAVGDDVVVEVTGAPALDYALNVHSADDVLRAEMIAFPVLFVVLLLVFRSFAAMAVPLLLAGVTLGITQAIGYGMTRVTDVNNLFVNIVTMVGLAVAVDYSLFIVKRFREELGLGRDVPSALARTMDTVGRSVLFSGLAVIVSLSALFIPRAMSFTSIALGGVAVTTVAATMALTLLPAVLMLLGHRINWGTMRWGSGRRKATASGPAQPAGAPKRDRLTRRPALLLAALTIGFTALAVPATQLTLQVPVASADILPEGDSARSGMERINEDIGLREMFPVQVVMTAAPEHAEELLRTSERIADYAQGVPEAEGVQGVTTLGIPDGELLETLDRTGADGLWSQENGQLVTRVMVTPHADPDSRAAHQLVDALRGQLDEHTGNGVTAQLAGATATGSDFDTLVLRSLPLVVGSVALLSFVILLFAFRSVLLPLLALVFNVAVVAASLGVLALVSSGDGQTINSVTPLMLFAVMFGLSMDYMVIMISRMREMYLGGDSHRTAVLGGLARTAGLVNGAAAIMVAVFASFTSAQISIVRELGISLAVAVILDAVVIRRLVMPSALLLVGERVWGRNPRRASGVYAPSASASVAPAPEATSPEFAEEPADRVRAGAPVLK